MRHGVECVNLLYPDSPKAKKWQEKNNGSLFIDTPKVNTLIDSIIRFEFPKFFIKDNIDRRAYIFRVFNSSFLFHLMQVDEKCSRLFREVTVGQKLFLDNNVLYHLCGFNGANVLKSAHNMMKYARELGYELWVTEKTIEEYQETLLWRMKEYKKCLPITSSLAKVAIDNLDTNSFIVAYWKELSEREISIEEFVVEKSHIDDLLKGLEINRTNEFRNQIENSTEFVREQAILKGVARDDTNPLIIEHDAFHRLFINLIRGGKKFNYQDSIAWFLTTDTKLPVYSRVANKGDNSLPFCLTIDQWIQVNRPFLSRTSNREEYETAFQVLVTQPYIRAMVSNQLMEKAYQNVLGRLSRYEKITPQLAFEIVTDTNFMVSIASSEESAVIDEKLESEFLNLSNKLHEEKTLLEGTNQQLLEQIIQIQTTTGEEVRKISEKFTAEKNNNQILETENKSLQKQMDVYKKFLKWALFAGITLISIYIVFFKIEIGPLLKLDSDFRILLAKLLIQLCIITIGLCIPLNKHWKYLIGTLLLSFIGLFLNVIL